VTRLQLRVKELEWEISILQSEIDSQPQTDGTEHLSSTVKEPQEPLKEVSDVGRVSDVKTMMRCCN